MLKQQSHWLNQRIWITGASSGIGKAIAERLLAEGARCVLSARDTSALEALSKKYPTSCHLLPMDVSDHSAIDRHTDQLKRKIGYLNLALFSAGQCDYLDYDHFDTDMITRIQSVNYLGSIYCCKIAISLLRKNQKDQIALMGSLTTYFPFQKAAPYGASKAAVRYFGQSLAVDLAPEGIHVSVIEPGFVKTPMTDRNHFSMPFMISADRAATIILNGLKHGKTMIRFPRRLAWTVMLMSLLPTRLKYWIANQF